MQRLKFAAKQLQLYVLFHANLGSIIVTLPLKTQHSVKFSFRIIKAAYEAESELQENEIDTGNPFSTKSVPHDSAKKKIQDRVYNFIISL